MKHLRALILAVGCIFFPFLAHGAVQPALRGPLSYALGDYAVVLGISLLAGTVSFLRRVRKGESVMSLSGLVGELTASALAGFMTFWVCEAIGAHPLISAASAGMAGHAGSSGLALAERIIRKHVIKRFNLGDTDHSPLNKD